MSVINELDNCLASRTICPLMQQQCTEIYFETSQLCTQKWEKCWNAFWIWYFLLNRQYKQNLLICKIKLFYSCMTICDISNLHEWLCEKPFEIVHYTRPPFLASMLVFIISSKETTYKTRVIKCYILALDRTYVVKVVTAFQVCRLHLWHE